MALALGTRVTVRDAYLDEAMTQPVTGTIEGASPRPDWGGLTAYVVMFDHDNARLPPGGEFSAASLDPVANR